MDDKTAVALLLALLLIVAALAAASPAAAAPPQPQGWVTLMAEDFEGEFPHSPWHIGRTGDPYLWGQRSCNPHGGAFSMWGGGGGAPWAPRLLVPACTPRGMRRRCLTAPWT